MKDEFFSSCFGKSCNFFFAFLQAAEKARGNLYELRAITAAVESSGQAKAEAEARAERLLIEGQSEIEGNDPFFKKTLIPRVIYGHTAFKTI